MTIECPNCGKKAIIRSRNSLTENDTVFDLYCKCTNQACGATFVCRAAFSHTINPPTHILNNLLNRLSKEERAQYDTDLINSLKVTNLTK